MASMSRGETGCDDGWLCGSRDLLEGPAAVFIETPLSVWRRQCTDTTF
jgi:hypothetical protein